MVAPICKAKSEEFDQKVLIGPSTAQARRDRRDVDRRGRLHLANCLNNTTDDCLLYKYGGKIELTASDASFMTHRDMRGHTGYRVFADSPRREKLLPCTNSCNAYYRLSRSTRVWGSPYRNLSRSTIQQIQSNDAFERQSQLQRTLETYFQEIFRRLRARGQQRVEALLDRHR